MEFSIAIPTFNEAGNIVPLLARLSTLLEGRDFEIIVADDDSPDLTWRAAADFAKDHPRVKVIRRTGREKGLSMSVLDAFRAAEGDILLVMDGDGQHDESCVPGMLALAEANDMVVGSRFAPGASIEEDWPFHRLLASRFAIFAAKLLLGLGVSDPMSGFFAVRREKFLRISARMGAEGFKIMLETLYLLKKADPGCHVAEMPIRFRRREKGESKLGFGVALDLLKMILRLKFGRG
jgi:dolichol-phosphate mannosyltransferase